MSTLTLTLTLFVFEPTLTHFYFSQLHLPRFIFFFSCNVFRPGGGVHTPCLRLKSFAFPLERVLRTIPFVYADISVGPGLA